MCYFTTSCNQSAACAPAAGCDTFGSSQSAPTRNFPSLPKTYKPWFLLVVFYHKSCFSRIPHGGNPGIMWNEDIIYFLSHFP
jgi:hypothetical protein